MSILFIKIITRTIYISRYYRKEILLTLLGVAVFYFVGIFEYPLILKDTIGRSVFNEYLFHHVKRHDDASFAFQNKQNLTNLIN